MIEERGEESQHGPFRIMVLGLGFTVKAELGRDAPAGCVSDTISALAAVGATDRGVMTLGLAGLGVCYVLTGLALRPTAGPPP